MAIGTTAAILGGAALGLAGSAMSSNAAEGAAKTQAQAAADAGQQEWAMYQQNREDQMPWLEQGTAAVGKLGTLLGTSGSASDEGYGSLLKSFGAEDFQADPGYAFRQAEGQKALERSAAAKGGLLSGAAAKAIQQRGQDIASDEYTNAYNRFNTNQNNIYNRLAGVANTGQVQANQLATQGTNVANSQSNLLTSAANANAAGQVGSSNAWTTGLSSVGNNLSTLAFLNQINGV